MCVVTLFTHERPAFFYLSRYLSAGKDPYKVSAFDRLHEHPSGRHTFRVLSVVWGIGLFVEASLRMMLADILPTSRYLAVSPFITAGVIGSLFAFTVVYTKRAQLEAALAPDCHLSWCPTWRPPPTPTPAPESNGMPQIPFP